MDDFLEMQAETAYDNYVGRDVPPPAPPSAPVLLLMAERVQKMRHEMDEVRGLLGQHADRLFGPTPQDGSGQKDSAYPDTAIGNLECALDALAATHTAVANEARRNCKLA